MMDINRPLGFWSLRVWGLVVNFCANALAIYGASGLIRDGSRIPHFLAGIGLTILCVVLLAKPDVAGPGEHREKR